MTHTQTTCPNCIAFRTGKKRACPAEAGTLVLVFENSATGRSGEGFNLFFYFHIFESHGKQHCGPKRGTNPIRDNPMPNQVWGVRILRDNGQDQKARSGNNYCSSIRVASIDKDKYIAIERLPWLTLKPLVQTASPFGRERSGRVLLKLEPWS